MDSKGRQEKAGPGQIKTTLAGDYTVGTRRRRRRRRNIIFTNTKTPFRSKK